MKQKSKIQKMAMCSLFTALTAVGAFIRIPVPVVPFTLQFLFTMLAGLFLGGKLGAVSVGPSLRREGDSGIFSNPASVILLDLSWEAM